MAIQRTVLIGVELSEPIIRVLWICEHGQVRIFALLLRCCAHGDELNLKDKKDK